MVLGLSREGLSKFGKFIIVKMLKMFELIMLLIVILFLFLSVFVNEVVSLGKLVFIVIMVKLIIRLFILKYLVIIIVLLISMFVLIGSRMRLIMI